VKKSQGFLRCASCLSEFSQVDLRPKEKRKLSTFSRTDLQPQKEKRKRKKRKEKKREKEKSFILMFSSLILSSVMPSFFRICLPGFLEPNACIESLCCSVISCK
jgi:hypothetical protein